ncbi:MAG: long-chain fatty acid--CoA ligase [Candidatus Bathyarchaeota archaeon]
MFQGRKICFQELNLSVNRFANGLKELGVKQGSRVGLYLSNCPEFIISHFATLKLGAISVPINPMYKGREIEYIILNSGVHTIIIDKNVYPHFLEVKSSLSNLKNVIATSDQPRLDTISFHEILTKNSPDQPNVEIRDEDLAVIGYTSGTTGRSKGATITHRNYISNIATLTEIWRWTSQDRLLVSLPLFHQHGLGIMLHGTVYTGSSMVLMERFNATKALQFIEKYACTVFMGVPTTYVRFLEVKDHQKFDFSTVRVFISGSAPLPTQVFNRFKEKYGFTILERYGMTETAVVNTSNPYDVERKPGKVGLPIPGVQVRIVNECGKNLALGQVGEIVVKGPNVMKGYWNMPEETAEAFRDGWLITGDLGKFDEDGYLTIVGRKKEMIITSGFKVYPREVEEVLASHPKVEETAVVGVPDPVRGEAVEAFVVLRHKEKATELEIVGYCKDKMAIFKVPRTVKFLQSLPRTESGKIIKSALIKKDSFK